MTYKKAIFSLPEPLVRDLKKFADIVSDGNKSKFVVEAIQEKMNDIRKLAHTAKMRKAYRDSAKDSLRILKEWEDVDQEMWQKLDELEK